MPERAGDESGQSGPETRLLALGRHSKIHVVPQPMVGIDVPESEVGTSVLGRLDLPRLDVGESVPLGTICCWIKAIVSNTAKNASTFGEAPDTVILHSSSQSEHIKLPHSAKEVVFHVVVAQVERGRVIGGELQESKDPERTACTLDGSWNATSWYSSLLTRWWSIGGVGSWR